MWVPSGWACGGFFCQNIPVDQSGEEILFGVNPDTGRVRAEIRIFYQGDAADFAWVLPLPNVPEISTGSDMVFDRLHAATRPQFQLDWADNGCDFWRAAPQASADGGFEEGAEDGGDDAGGVTVIDSGQVGAFEYAILSSSSAEELVDWLNDNDFDQPPSSTPLIEGYVEQGMVFVALKLQKTASSGDITPIVLEFAESAPCVPLVLTQIAAAPNMPVTVWVASDARVVPTNWFEVTPNLKKLDWLNGGSNYVQLVTDAVNEAAGRAFVTDFSGSRDILEGALFREGEFNTDALAAAVDPVAFIEALQQQFGSANSTLLAILRKHIPLPAEATEQGVSEQSFYSCPACWPEFVDAIAFDAAAAAQDVEDRVVAPLRASQEMVDAYGVLTRLFTTVSPDEMTRDPIFQLRSDLPEIPRLRSATANAECDGNSVTGFSITLPNGATFSPPLSDWLAPVGYAPDDLSAEPNAAEIVLIPAEGAPFVLETDEVAFADNQLNTTTAELVIEALGGPEASGPEPKSVDRGCAQGPAGPTACLLLASLGAVAQWRRRRAH
jgi:hypothetical protein